MTLVLPFVVAECPQEGGFLNSKGGCLVEASSKKHELAIGIVVAIVSVSAFQFILHWSYGHSNRVLATIHSFVTGVDAAVMRFTFEIIGTASDVQAIVSVFMYDLTIAHPTLIRSTT